MKFKSVLFQFILALFLLTQAGDIQYSNAQVTPRPIAATSIYNGAGFLYVPTATPFGNQACYFDNNSTLASSVTTSTELSYVHGTTSNIQAQIDALVAGATLSVFGRTGNVTAQSGDYSSFYPLKSNNLSDIASAPAARANLGLGTAATQSTAAFDASGAASAAQAAAQAASDPVGSATAAQAASLQKTSNLSDLVSASTARTNLGLGTIATQSSASFLGASNNLSELSSPSTARTNLGLGSAATQNTAAFDASGAATAAQAASLQKTSNLSDLANASTARGNLGLGSAAVQPSTAFDASGAAAAAQAAAQAASDPAGSAAAVLATSLQKANNLSEIASASAARTNLGLGSAATQSTAAFDASGAAAAVLATSLQKANNLSDLVSTSTARTNLGLGSAATQSSSAFDASGAAAAAQAAAQAASDPVGSAATAQAASLQKASNLSDLTSPSNARANLGLGTAATQSTAAFQSPLTFSGSLVNTAGTVALLNDATNPGATQFYGTDSFGFKGWYPVPTGGSGGGGGGVSSVALSAPAWLTVGGSPITTFGTLTLTGTSEPANEFLASPNGSAGALSPRAIVAADIPTLNQSTTGNAATATALAAIPAQCPGGSVSTGIGANGDANCVAGGGTGTVTSVGLSLPASELTVSGSPVTTSGTLSASWASQASNKVFAAPNGSAGTPTFRLLSSADIPFGAIATDLIPTVNGSDNIGSTGFRWNDLWSSGTAHLNNINANNLVSAIQVGAAGASYFFMSASRFLEFDIASTSSDTRLEFLCPTGGTCITNVPAFNGTNSLIDDVTAQTLSNKTFGNAQTLTQITTPSNPAAGFDKCYVKSDDKFYCLTSGGVEQLVGPGGGGGSGTVTTVSVASANGFSGTVTNPTTTPAITLSTSISGVLKGNGTAISAASAGTDYQAPVSVGALDAQAANATGLAFVSNVLSTQSADATHPGMVNTTTQTFAGNKTFSGTVGASNLSGTNSGDVTLTAVGASPNANGASLSGQALTLQPFDDTHPGVVTASGGGTTNFLRADGTWALPPGGGGSGTVTSVALTAPGFLSVAGSPVTTSGTLALSLATQSANTVFAGPTSGGAVAPTFRNLVAGDIPALPYSSSTLTSAHLFIGNGSNVATDTAVTGDVTISNAGVAAIGSNKVANSQLAQMAAHTFKGNNTGSTANAIDLTDTQATAELDAMVGDSGAGGTKGLVPAPASGDAAAGKFLKADGTWTVPTGGSGGSSVPSPVRFVAAGAIAAPANAFDGQHVSPTTETIGKVALSMQNTGSQGYTGVYIYRASPTGTIIDTRLVTINATGTSGSVIANLSVPITTNAGDMTWPGITTTPIGGTPSTLGVEFIFQ